MHEKILMIEELAPVVEEAVRQVAGCVPVFGKINGYDRTKANFTGRCRCYHGKGRVPARKTRLPPRSLYRTFRYARPSSAPAAITVLRSTR